MQWEQQISKCSQRQVLKSNRGNSKGEREEERAFWRNFEQTNNRTSYNRIRLWSCYWGNQHKSYNRSRKIRTAISKIKNCKSVGKDNITVELLKADIEISREWPEDLFKTIWDSEEVLKSWKPELIVKTPKKRDLTECGNLRQIS